MKHSFALRAITLAVLSNLPGHVSALTPDMLFPRVTGQFLAGNQEQLSGFGDALVPLLQNHNGLLFADGEVMLGSHRRSTLSTGLGYRRISTLGLRESIIGAFLLTDYYQTRLRKYYWQLNPGIEWLSGFNELRLQGYFPLSKRNKIFGNTTASQISEPILYDSGNTNHNLFGARGHQIIDTPVSLVEAFGPGVEIEGGHFFDVGRGIWLRAGGYHFNYQNARNITGIEANIEAVLNQNVSFLIQDNYDNQNKNRLAVGFRVTFGGTAAAPINSLENRITSPIIRHLARQSYGEPLPTRLSFQQIDAPFALYDNVWFFSPEGAYPLGGSTTFANCTAEYPCLTIDNPTAEKINQLATNANLFFAPGSYLISPNALNQSNWVLLQNGQSVYGRDYGWFTPAIGNNRPIINGSLVWGNQNSGINPIIASGAIYDLRVNNINQIVPTSVFKSGNGFSGILGVAATGNMFVHGSDVHVVNTNNNISAISVGAGQKAIMGNSTLGAINFGTATSNENSNSIGVFANNNVIVKDSLINALAAGNSTGAKSFASAFAIQSYNGNALIVNSMLNAQTKGNANTGGNCSATGASIQKNATLVGSTISAITNGNALAASISAAGGLSAESVQVSNSSITATATGIANGINSNASVIAVQTSLGDAQIIHSILNAQTSGIAIIGGNNSALGVFSSKNAIVKDTVMNANTIGDTNTGGVNNALGIVSVSNTTIDNSLISANTAGLSNGNSSSAMATAIESLSGNASISNSVISAATHGAVLNNSNNSVIGIKASANAEVINSFINTSTSGNGVMNTVIGLLANHATVTRSLIDVKATGLNSSAIGIKAANTVIFNGNMPSFVNTISPSGGIPIIASVIANNSVPKSKCSTDGLIYIDC